MHTRFQYTREHVACVLCTEYRRRRGCTTFPCPWLAERIEAGAVGYEEALLESFPHNARLLARLQALVQIFPGSLWSGEDHRRRMEELKSAAGLPETPGHLVVACFVSLASACGESLLTPLLLLLSPQNLRFCGDPKRLRRYVPVHSQPGPLRLHRQLLLPPQAGVRLRLPPGHNGSRAASHERLQKYIDEGRHIILKGASGNGKTYIACALGNAACRKFKTVRCTRIPELLDELSVAKANGEFGAAVRAYKKVDLLILDEWLIRRLTPRESYDLLEIVEA